MQAIRRFWVSMIKGKYQHFGLKAVCTRGLLPRRLQGITHSSDCGSIRSDMLALPRVTYWSSCTQTWIQQKRKGSIRMSQSTANLCHIWASTKLKPERHKWHYIVHVPRHETPHACEEHLSCEYRCPQDLLGSSSSPASESISLSGAHQYELR